MKIVSIRARLSARCSHSCTTPRLAEKHVDSVHDARRNRGTVESVDEQAPLARADLLDHLGRIHGGRPRPLNQLRICGSEILHAHAASLQVIQSRTGSVCSSLDDWSTTLGGRPRSASYSTSVTVSGTATRSVCAR